MTQGQEAGAPQPEGTGGQEQTQSPQGQQEQQPQETPDAFLARTGFKSLAEAEKSFKEAQAKITKVSQEKAQLEQALQGQVAQSQQQPPPIQPRGGQGTDFFDDPEGSVMRIASQVASRQVAETVQQLEARQAIERVRAENPTQFDKLKPIMSRIYQEKPFLNNLGEVGLRQAMEEATTIRSQELKELKAELFADGEQNPQDIKSQAKQEVLDEMNRNKQATIPQGGVSRPMTDDVRKKAQQAISEGDIDGLLDLKFSNLRP